MNRKPFYPRTVPLWRVADNLALGESEAAWKRSFWHRSLIIETMLNEFLAPKSFTTKRISTRTVLLTRVG